MRLYLLCVPNHQRLMTSMKTDNQLMSSAGHYSFTNLSPAGTRDSLFSSEMQLTRCVTISLVFARRTHIGLTFAMTDVAFRRAGLEYSH